MYSIKIASKVISPLRKESTVSVLKSDGISDVLSEVLSCNGELADYIICEHARITGQKRIEDSRKNAELEKFFYVLELAFNAGVYLTEDHYNPTPKI